MVDDPRVRTASSPRRRALSATVGRSVPASAVALTSSPQPAAGRAALPGGARTVARNSSWLAVTGC
jgi:hypothetical protein